MPPKKAKNKAPRGDEESQLDDGVLDPEGEHPKGTQYFVIQCHSVLSSLVVQLTFLAEEKEASTS